MFKARLNPFAVDRVLQVRYQFASGHWPEFLARLESLGFRGALVGPQGAGKTTLLEDLEIRLRERQWRVQRWRFPVGQRTLPRETLGQLAQFGSHDFLLLDSAEQLGFLAWRRFLAATARAGGLVITTHRPGYLPTLVECRTSPALLAHCVRRLVGNEHRLDGAELEALFRAHRGNVRECRRELYDRWAAGHAFGRP